MSVALATRSSTCSPDEAREARAKGGGRRRRSGRGSGRGADVFFSHSRAKRDRAHSGKHLVARTRGGAGVKYHVKERGESREGEVLRDLIQTPHGLLAARSRGDERGEDESRDEITSVAGMNQICLRTGYTFRRRGLRGPRTEKLR